jgi:hypothetical protein
MYVSWWKFGRLDLTIRRNPAMFLTSNSPFRLFILRSITSARVNLRRAAIKVIKWCLKNKSINVMVRARQFRQKVITVRTTRILLVLLLDRLIYAVLTVGAAVDSVIPRVQRRSPKSEYTIAYFNSVNHE